MKDWRRPIWSTGAWLVLSAILALGQGTVILTGTPHGVGFARKPPVFMKPGDSITIEIEKIGRLTNPVVEEA